MKDLKMANKGKMLEVEIELANEGYKKRGIALIQKISTPWTVIRAGNKIVSAFPAEKSTLDFRGTVNPAIPVSFDAKESEDQNGLPLKHIKPHQVEYIKNALGVGELSFIVCFIKPLNRRYRISGQVVIDYWDYWQNNKGKRGVNYIPIADMVEIRSRAGIILDYLDGLVDA